MHKDDDPLLLVIPSDHVIKNVEAFEAAVKKAAPLAEDGFLVTFGIVPDRPETGFGYLRKGDSIGAGFKVERFEEKPPLDLATEYVTSGQHFWNSGMFLFKASVYLSELGALAPEMLTTCEKALADSIQDLDFVRLCPEAFAQCPSDSIDYAVMEKTDKCVMVSMDADWSDLGSWSAMYDAKDKDRDNNVLVGDVIALDTKNSYLHAETRLLAAVGLDNIVAVETADTIFVAPKDKTQDVKKLVEELCDSGRSEAMFHRKVYRPWGAYECTDQDERFQVKRITVKPGQILSLQKHHHRSEHWVVVSGTAK